MPTAFPVRSRLPDYDPSAEPATPTAPIKHAEQAPLPNASIPLSGCCETTGTQSSRSVRQEVGHAPLGGSKEYPPLIPEPGTCGQSGSVVKSMYVDVSGFFQKQRTGC